MLSLEERTEFAGRVAETLRIGAYAALIELLAPFSDEQLLSEPELGAALARAYYRTDQFDAARRLNQRLLERSRGGPADGVFRRQLILRGILDVEDGDLAGAESAFREAMAFAVRSGDQGVLADAMMNLGVIAWIEFRWDEALTSYRRALTAYSVLGRTYHIAACHQNLGMTFREMDLPQESDSQFEKAHQLYSGDERHRKNELSSVELERALLISALGDHERAEAMARHAFSRVSHSGASKRQAEVLRVLGIISGRRGSLHEARRYLTDALSLCGNLRTPLLKAEVCEALSETERSAGDAGAAAHWAEEAGQIYVRIGARERSQRVRTSVADAGAV